MDSIWRNINRRSARGLLRNKPIVDNKKSQTFSSTPTIAAETGVKSFKENKQYHAISSFSRGRLGKGRLAVE